MPNDEGKKVLQLVRRTSGGDVAEVLAVIDSLRKAVESGEIVAFATVGIQANDGTLMWLGNVGLTKSNLQFQGAVAALAYHFGK